MILLEIPLQTIRDQASSLENAARSEEDEQFVLGALSALAWLTDPVASDDPASIVLRRHSRETLP